MNEQNRLTKICRRISEIEHALACNDQSEMRQVELKDELDSLNIEYDKLKTI